VGVVVAVGHLVVGVVMLEGVIAGGTVFEGLAVEYFDFEHSRSGRSRKKRPVPEAVAPYFAAVDNCC